MMSDKLRKLIELLTFKTLNKQTIWNKSSSANQFKLLLAQGIAVTVSRWEEQYIDNVDYALNVFNSDGAVIESFVTDSNNDTTSEDIKLLHGLYKAITDQYYKVEETLEMLLSSLNTSDIIGVKEDTKKIDEDDELPF